MIDSTGLAPITNATPHAHRVESTVSKDFPSHPGYILRLAVCFYPVLDVLTVVAAAKIPQHGTAGNLIENIAMACKTVFLAT